MGSINLNRKLWQTLTLFCLSICSSLSVNGSHLSFHESECQIQRANDTISAQCSQNSTILFEMTKKFRQITIHCHNENPFHSKFLPKLNTSETKHSVFLNSCQFPAHEPIQHVLETTLGILEPETLDLDYEFIDNFPTSNNLKGLDNIDHLVFNFNNLSAIPEDFFVNLKLLKSLRISSRTSNQLHFLFDSLENLKSLDIIDNNFQFIPANIFKHQTKLEILSLSNNNLTTITKELLDRLTNLLKLDLSFNNIQTLEPDIFSNLKNLSEIYLSGNKFKSLPDDLFYKNKKLYLFELEQNQVALKQLPQNLLSNLLKLEDVTIKNCQLESISSNFFENSSKIYFIDISGNNLNDLPLGIFDDQVKLNTLILSNNKIQTLPDGLFQATRNLYKLDLSNNQLKYLSNDISKPLTQLEFLKLDINILGTNFSNNHQQFRSPFDPLTKLEILNLKNNSINKLFNTILFTNPKKIFIDLSFNKIKSINCENVGYLEYFNLMGNPLHCDCKIRCLTEVLTSLSMARGNTVCQTPKVLKGRALADLELIDLLCYLKTQETSFLKQCSNECLYAIFNSYLIMNCSNGNLTKMPVLPEFDPSFSKGIKLYIQGNPITELSPNTLQDNQNISVFNISLKRRISTLPEGYFSNMPKLERIHIDLQLLDIPSDLFAGSTAIEEIYITGMNLKNLPKSIFESQTELITLILQRNGLKKLEEYSFSSNINLETLDLSHNSLEILTEQMFYQLQNLKYLFLGYNCLRDVSPSVFKYTNSLYRIGMENNRITTFEPFSILNSLFRANLSSNKISSIEFSDLFGDGYFHKFKKIDFTNNNIQTITVNKSDLYFDDSIELSLGYNPINCDCNIIPFVEVIRNNKKLKFVENLQCMTPVKLKNQFVSELQLNELVCRSEKCPQGCQCWDQPYDSIIIVNCSNANLTQLPQLSELELAPLNRIELFIEFNQIKRLEFNPKSRSQHISKIYAANNSIDYISSADIPIILSHLDLSYNQLKRLDTEVINKFTESQNLHFIRLSHNPWVCDCSAEKLKQFILLNKKQIILDSNKTLCADGRTFENLSFVDMLCYPETDHTVSVISIALGIVGLSICLLTILFFKNKERVLIWMYARGICLWWIKEEEIDKNKKYDAFVSYSSLDTEFVVNEFLPMLEGGPTPFKLCLHDRDWIGGVFIPDQIQKSVEYSKRTIILMSQNYLKSKWTRLEFRTAHSLALNEKLPRVIVVIINDIGEVDDLDSDFKKYIKMYTYLRWDDPWFWKKLRYAMPHPARKNHQNEATEISLDRTGNAVARTDYSSDENVFLSL